MVVVNGRLVPGLEGIALCVVERNERIKEARMGPYAQSQTMMVLYA